MAKIKELKEQYPSYKIDVIDVLSQMDPTKTKKMKLSKRCMKL